MPLPVAQVDAAGGYKLKDQPLAPGPDAAAPSGAKTERPKLGRQVTKLDWGPDQVTIAEPPAAIHGPLGGAAEQECALQDAVEIRCQSVEAKVPVLESADSEFRKRRENVLAWPMTERPHRS